jgi:hypothetical protein
MIPPLIVTVSPTFPSPAPIPLYPVAFTIPPLISIVPEVMGGLA